MLKFAIKNLLIKKVQVFLVILSITLSAGIAILAYNVATQVDKGITTNAGYYSAIVGPTGSKTQLAMNTMYFAESPVGTIPYSVVTELQKDSKVTCVIPFAMADNYLGYGVVGTTTPFLDGKTLKQGELFDDTQTMQVVVGYTVAKYCDLAVGDVIYTSHSANGLDTHTQGMTVVGILNESHSAYDRVVFTQIKTLWSMHDHSGEHDDHEEHDEHNTKTVCAILVKTLNPTYAMQLVNLYDGKIYKNAEGDEYVLQAIEPMSVVRDVLQDADDTKYIVFVLCGVILLMNVMIVSVITLLNTYHSAKEISLMRLIGISTKKINCLYLLQNGIIGVISVLLAFGLSRLCMFLINDYVSAMGVVLNVGAVFGVEILILFGVFLISIIPTLVWTLVRAKRDGLEG